INLSWSASTGAASYNVKRSTTNGGPYTVIATDVTTTHYADPGLTNGMTYYYVVSAVNTDGEGVNSDEASATAGLRVHLKFDETSGTVAADSSGAGWGGLLVNGPTWTAGALNSAVDLDGTDDHVSLSADVVNGLSGFTVSTWVYLDTVSNWSRIFDFGTGTSVNMFLTPRNGASNVVRYAITTGGGAGEQRIDGTAALPTGTWKHVAVTWAGNVAILYVDGIEVGRNNSMTLNPTSLGNTTRNYIGKSQYADPNLDGRVDDFRIYASALDASEIAAMVSAGMPVPSEPTGLSATAVSSSQINLAWTAVSGAASYNVKRSSASGTGYTTVVSGVTATSYSDTGLANGTTYHYVVSAVNAGGEGGNSAEASATPSAPITDEELRCPTISFAEGNLNLVTANSVPGHQYQVEVSPDLTTASWQAIGDPQPGTGGDLLFSMPDDPEIGRRFFRLRVKR
ncbi:MAG TPA: LamG-like jellyroll fold domain-containing protein, partial [Candidatus Paceibacterota bacterium]|nr:LamG-like jellyroll fold domain-containing protein [Candidatus Paceibacterota bacterium]